MPADVSVIVPTYNCGAYIGEALDSVFAQTSQPRQVIVVDDGSTDDTREVVGRFGAAVTYVHQQNQGVSRARNVGLGMAESDWVLFLDADDRLEPSALASMAALADSGRYGVIYGDKLTIDVNGAILERVPARDCTGPTPAAARASFGGAAFEPGAAIVRRSIAGQLGGFDGRYTPCEDRHFWIRCGLRCEFGHVPDVVFHYRLRPGSLSKNRARQVPNALRVRLDVLNDLHQEGRTLFDPDPEPADLLDANLGDVYWMREWAVVDAVLAVAREYQIDTPIVRATRRRRALAPLVRLKDHIEHWLR